MHTSPVPIKITKLPSQHSMLGHQSAKRHLNGVRWQANDGPLLVVLGSSLSSSTKKNVVKAAPPPPCFHVPRPPRANNNSGGFDLRHHAVLETLSAADNIS